jgi:hypothetical protein
MQSQITTQFNEDARVTIERANFDSSEEEEETELDNNVLDEEGIMKVIEISINDVEVCRGIMKVIDFLRR